MSRRIHFLFFKISHSSNLRTNFNTPPHSSQRISKNSTAYLCKVSRSKKMLLCWLKTTSLSLWTYVASICIGEPSFSNTSEFTWWRANFTFIGFGSSEPLCFIKNAISLLRYARLIQYCLNLGCIKLVVIHKERHMLLTNLLKLLLNEHLIGYWSWYQMTIMHSSFRMCLGLWMK